jgi:NitT/TauT family transport system permease protein
MARAINLGTPQRAGGRLSWARLLRQVAFFIILLLLWQGLSLSSIWPNYLFPGPLAVATNLFGGLQSGIYVTAILVSLRRLAIGYGISLIFGVILGLVIGRNRYLEETIGSLVLGLQALPSVCWIPLALLWFGLSEQAMIFVVVMGALFSITLGVDSGVKNTPPLYLKAATNMGAKGFALASQVILPAALPAVLTGLKQGWTFAWRSLMAAELIYQTVSLGTQLETGRDFNDTSQIFAVMFIIIVIGVAIDTLIFAPLEQRVRERWGLVA